MTDDPENFITFHSHVKLFLLLLLLLLLLIFFCKNKTQSITLEFRPNSKFGLGIFAEIRLLVHLLQINILEALRTGFGFVPRDELPSLSALPGRLLGGKSLNLLWLSHVICM
jgi:hypothetical protein